MKYLILIFAATVLAVNSASAKSNPFKLEFKQVGKNKISIQNNDNDNPFPPELEPVEPFRMGNWKVMVVKYTSTFDGETWSFTQETVCVSTAQAGVFNLIGIDDGHYVEAPTASIIRCTLEYEGGSYAVDFTPYVIFGATADPFTGQQRLSKHYMFWQWPVMDDQTSPPKNFFDQLIVSQNMGTSDLELNNALFYGAQASIAICRGSDEDTEPLPGPMHDDDDTCTPPNPGTTIETFGFAVEMNDPEGGL